MLSSMVNFIRAPDTRVSRGDSHFPRHPGTRPPTARGPGDIRLLSLSLSPRPHPLALLQYASFVRGDLRSFLSRRRIANGQARFLGLCFYSSTSIMPGAAEAPTYARTGPRVGRRDHRLSLARARESSIVLSPRRVALCMRVRMHATIARLVVRHDT